MSSACLCGTHASQLPARSSAVKQVAERVGDRAVGTPAERCWGAACLPCRGGGALQDIPLPPSHPRASCLCRNPSQKEGITRHPRAPRHPAGRPPCQPPRLSSSLMGEVDAPGPVVLGDAHGDQAASLRGLWGFRAFSPGCWEENGARRPLGFSLLGNVTVLGSDGLLRSSGRCAFDLCVE